MAGRPIHMLFISLLLYDLAFGDYCRNTDNSSIQFCQSGIISGSKVYINSSSVKTKEELKDRECVCYLEQIGNENIHVNADGSCVYCGLQVKVGEAYFRSNTQGQRWGFMTLNDSKFSIILSLDGNTNNLSTAFCITIQLNQYDSSVVLKLTCEELVAKSSTTILTSPNVITTPPTIVPDTLKSMSPTSTETAIPPKTETTKPTTVNAGNTNGTHGPNANNTYRMTTTTATTTITITTENDLGEPRLDIQKEVIIPAAAGGGAGVLVILVIVIVVCCLRKKRKHAEDPINMKEPERSDAIMTDNVAYGIYTDTNTNSVPHVQAHYTGDVYAVVNKEGTSNVYPSVEVPRMQVAETGDVYAIVNKTTVRDIPNIEHSREESAKSRIQTKSDNNNVTVDITPSTDYADITIGNSSV